MSLTAQQGQCCYGQRKAHWLGAPGQVWYNASDAKGPPPSNGWDPPSGAYLFRPNGEFGSGAPVHVRIVEGPLLTEVHQVPPGRSGREPGHAGLAQL